QQQQQQHSLEERRDSGLLQAYTCSHPSCPSSLGGPGVAGQAVARVGAGQESEELSEAEQRARQQQQQQQQQHALSGSAALGLPGAEASCESYASGQSQVYSHPGESYAQSHASFASTASSGGVPTVPIGGSGSVSSSSTGHSGGASLGQMFAQPATMAPQVLPSVTQHYAQ
ncbi:hypothetical protein CRUP_034012, partial [Coryphaenoides rupestris]